MFYKCYKLTKVKISQETYDKMTRFAKRHYKTLEDYICLSPSTIEIITKK